jgi:hypothetical protein
MHTDAQIRKAGGRLSREDQRRLGDILQRVYDDVLRQGVPDRFKELLNKLDKPKEGSDPEKSSLRAEAHETGGLLGVKALDNKGSR